MAYGPFSLLLTRRLLNPKPSTFSLSHLVTLTKPFSTSQDPNAKPSTLSARLSFVFDQIDAIEKERSEKHETLQRIRAWRQSKNPQSPLNDTVPPSSQSAEDEKPNSADAAAADAAVTAMTPDEVKKEVELVHPWPEWIQLIERLVHQNYFDHRRKDEDKMVQDAGFDAAGDVADDSDIDFTKDFKSVHEACLNFGKDRFDILSCYLESQLLKQVIDYRSLSRKDIQSLVGFGCPNVDKKVVFSAKLLRKHAHLDEGDVCSSCSLRNNCDRAYLLTNKEDEARTLDVMRVLLTFGFDPVNGPVTNKSLLKQKSVKTVVRKLLHEVVKLSSVPIDPNLPPPVIKKPPPKVKQPPPPPKKRVGRDDVEMKKGDWLCPKCDFMNFAKNTICLQCDAKRPKRQLLPGEWECPQCNFLNYRRNVVCFHCECKRPHDEFMESQMQDTKPSSKPKFNKVSRPEVSNAWNFDFDDNESDGADVAAFEYADAKAIDEDFRSDNLSRQGNYRGWEGDFGKNNRVQGSRDEEYANPAALKPGVGFDDFEDEDDDDIDSYELETKTHSSSSSTRVQPSRNHFSEVEGSSDLDDVEDTYDKKHARNRTGSRRNVRSRGPFSDSEDDELYLDTDKRAIHSNFKSGHSYSANQKIKGRGPTKKLSFGSDSDEDDAGAGLFSDDDDDLNDVYSSRKNKGNKHDFSRPNKGTRHDSGNRSFTEYRKSGSTSGRCANKFRDDYGGSSQQSYRNGRGSQGNDRSWKKFEDFDKSTSYGNSRGKSFGNGRGRRGSDRNSLEDFDKSTSYGNSRGKSFGNGRGPRGSDHNSLENFDKSTSYGNSRGKSFGNDRGPRGSDLNSRRFEDRARGTGQFNKYGMDEEDFGGFRNSRRVIER
ncbi:hypothetical protein PIB30_028496 [Stylosanthes scabra]|uniref:RanBP2-type domain-containing protein n=1 Tax=Stylosanthes scabra TaxID=79078 RepID=A0ABU6Z8P8_9FABA|nr:hypothetical protein [Stylosanthes scabra]